MTYMHRALALAKNAVGSSSPNPAVGAVLVKEGRVIGEGWTQPPGQGHAEAMALEQAGPEAKGATLYVTLEPCDHFGRTPPCAPAIIEAGIVEVHAAMVDPNPLVGGKGLSRLNESGITTYVGEHEKEARQVTEAWVKFITTGTPFVTAKFAMSLDGKIATRTGDSRWVTGEEARGRVQQMRAASDAIMVGIGTVLADDPRLTARNGQGQPSERQPLRVVVDSGGRTPLKSALLAEPGRTLIVVSGADEATCRALVEAGAEVEKLPAENGSVDLSELLAALGRRDVTSVLVEGGGTLLGSLFDRGLVDKVVAFVAPIIVGGLAAPSPVAGAGVERLAQARRLDRISIVQLGPDVAVVGYCEAKSDVHRNS
jgi:diaminohydroxyphosphoribosylaminopyrimidine deaminase/5-amino-6-(5-phosphoribosylamino)uracil reductase